MGTSRACGRRLSRWQPTKRPRSAAAWVVAIVAAGLAVAACRPPTGPALPEVGRPNILLIALDQASTRLGTYGSPARTPRLDGLAARGRRFDRAYRQYPARAASRLSLVLGRRPESTGFWTAPESRAAFEGAAPLPEALHAAG